MSESFERKEDAGKPPAGIVSRWLAELRLSENEEKEWRKSAEAAYKRYRGANVARDGKANAGMNILWSNTETLRPALYNSTPKPDVRRRFKDADPIGKYVSDVLERALSFSNDDEDFDDKIVGSVLDMLLPGRGVCRVRYVPSFRKTQGPDAVEHDEEAEEPTHERGEGINEEVAWEQVATETVHWADFRRGPGKKWDEIPWIAFRHRLTREQLEEKFGDIGKDAPLEECDLGDESEKDDHLDKTVFKRATVWEIWCKDDREVIWIHPNMPDQPLGSDSDPLNLVGFFPIPRPLMATEDTDSLVPVTLFSLYKSQAEEIDRLTVRIQRIIGAIKARGAYDSSLGPALSEILKGEDNEFTPVAALAFAEKGLDKAIWFAPIDQLVKVLVELINQRNELKQVIYEITGISDILRGATNANETATAQQIKSQWGSLRLQRMQRDVQRFVRDLMRIKAEIIAEKFSPDTLRLMTGIQLPTAQQKQMMEMQGQQLPMPSWEEVIQVMKDDSLRSFRIDIETDSTVQAQIAEDQQAFAQGIQAITGFLTAIGTAVQVQAFPIEAVKAICMAWVRRTKLGREVEDALEGIKAPQPPQQPEDNSAQVEQMRMQQEAQIKQAEMQQAQQIKAAELQHAQQMEQSRQSHEAALEDKRMGAEMRKAQADLEIKRIEAQIKQTELQLKHMELQLREKEIDQNGSMEVRRIESDAEAKREAKAEKAESE